jgi:hypothetical protein
MTRHGDFCLSPGNLIRALIVLLLAMPVFAVWGWLAPAMPMAGDLILIAIYVLGLTYIVKMYLKYLGEAGTLWTRAVGCLTSAIIAFGNLALTWAVANGIHHGNLDPRTAAFLIFPLALLLGHLFYAMEFVLKDKEERDKLAGR